MKFYFDNGDTHEEMKDSNVVILLYVVTYRSV